MESIEFGFSHGFTCGIQKVADQFDAGLLDDMKRHGMRVTQKSMRDLFKCMIDNRELLRENPFAFVRCNKDVPGGFEVYMPKGKEV